MAGNNTYSLQPGSLVMSLLGEVTSPRVKPNRPLAPTSGSDRLGRLACALSRLHGQFILKML